MSSQTDLSVSPYFDDFANEKDFYKVLFKPGVSVQVRELNQLQSILQSQIQRFGDNIFKQGTIIEGCDIVFHPDLQYVKLRDITTNSEIVNVGDYEGYRVRNQNDLVPLQAVIITTTSGFESTAPDLNTLYLRYINSGYRTGGSANGYTKFEASEVLTVYNPDLIVERVSIPDSGKSQGFSPNDRVVFLSAVEVQNTSSGTAFSQPLVVGDYISDGTANVQIVAISNTAIPGSLVFSIKPRVDDLKANDPVKWTTFVGNNLQRVGSTPSSIAQVKSIVGAGAAGRLTTATLGRAEAISITSKGSGYIVPPTVSIASPSNLPTNIALFTGTAETFIANITVADSINSPIGNSYAITVGEGIIYQKGYFSRVGEQLLLLEKYTNVPNDISVGFETNEDIVSSNQDTSLLDNATGAPNFTAPGADRLKLTPRLIYLTKEEASQRDDFLYVVEYSDGQPYKQNRQTVYNIIGSEIAKRTSEESGDYVLDQFNVQTKSPNNFTDEDTSFSIVIDPGKAYISGKRVETVTNFETNIQKGTSTVTAVNANISMNFGNYVRVNEFSGLFNFKVGDIVKLYANKGSFISSNLAGTVPSNASLGTQLGTARIRSVVFDSGVPGTAASVYRLYLFDINMTTGTNFKNVKSIFYDGAIKGLADTVQENNETILNDTTTSSLLYYAGAEAVQNVSSISYIYRTSNTYQVGTNGKFTIALNSGGSEVFPYTGQLSAIQERDVILVPQANTEAATNLSGTITVTSGSTDATVAGSTATAAELRPGDFIKIGTAGVVQIDSVANNTNIKLISNATFNASANTYKYVFPANVPVSFEYRTDRTFTVDVTKKQLEVDFGITLASAQNISAVYNVKEGSVVPIAKTVNRSKYVRLCLGNNVTYSAGPWCLGVADAFRLNKVYRGANSTFIANTAGIVDVTQYFYIDHNQNEDYTNVSYLYLKPNSGLQLANTTSEFLLVSFDYFSTSAGVEGLKAPGGSGTYNINDEVTLENAVNSVNTLELPEVFSDKGAYYDLRDHFDLRPSTNNSVIPNSDANSAPINPVEQTPSNLFSSTDKKFPAPDSELNATINYYIGRKDLVVVDASNEFRVINGVAGSENPPTQPENALTLQILNIPAYPSVPFILSADTLKYVDTKIANEKYTTRRLNKYRITTAINSNDRNVLQPRRYTMQDIGSLERRIESLEYYTSLNLSETFAKKRVIPGFDGLDRFKFGFYVDGFEDYTLADLENPGYSASIVDGYLTPKVSEVNLNLRAVTDGSDSTMPFNEVNFITQNRATVDTGNTGLTRQTIVCINQAERNTNRSNDGNVFEEFFYTMSELSGPVEFYINSRDNYIGAEIFKSVNPNGPWTTVTSSASAVAITQSDIISKNLRLNRNQKIEGVNSLDRKSFPSSTSWGTWLEDQFKLLWTHNPTGGIYYKIRIYKGGKGGGVFSSGKRGTFEYKLCYPVDSTVNATVNVPTTAYPITYNGLVLNGSVNFLDINSLYIH